MKKFISSVLVLALSFALMPNLVGASSNLLSSANADADFVYMVEDTTVNYTGASQAHDQKPVQVFTNDDGDTQYLYIGAKSQFDKVIVNTIKPAKYENSSTGLTWQYYGNGKWNTFSVTDGSNSFTKKGTSTISFSLPSSWSKTNYQNNSAYWLRVSPKADVNLPAMVEQISLRSYNIALKVKDSDGDNYTKLTSSDVSLSQGTDNTIFAFSNRGSGEYWLSLNSKANDTSYSLQIKESGYKTSTITLSSIGTSFKSYNVTLTDSDSNVDPKPGPKPRDPDVNLISDNTPFVDLDDVSWAVVAIDTLYERGIVHGRSYYYYEPADNVTRAEFLKIILLSAGVDVNNYSSKSENFRDVSSTDWFRSYVKAGLSLGIINENMYFYPNTGINRAEAVAMLVRTQEALKDIDLDPNNVSKFWDVSSNDWYARYLSYASKYGIIQGYNDGSFQAENSLNRAEASVIAYRAIKTWWK